MNIDDYRLRVRRICGHDQLELQVKKPEPLRRDSVNDEYNWQSIAWFTRSGVHRVAVEKEIAKSLEIGFVSIFPPVKDESYVQLRDD